MLQEDGQFIITVMCKGGDKNWDGTHQQTWRLFVTASPDQEHYTKPTVLLKGSNAWDKYMYRACMVKADGRYRLYYSALDERKAHYLGIAEAMIQ